MTNQRWIGGVLAVLAAASVGCGLSGRERSPDPGGQGAPPPPPPPSSPAQTRTTAPAEKAGTVQVTFRGTAGTDRVSCSSINGEFAVSAYAGPIRWTVQALDRQPTRWPYDASPVSGVVAEPGSGALSDGERAVVRLRGSFSGGREFYVAVSAPNQTGHSWAVLHMTCR